ncbi:Molybdenum cofactor biosynthesis, MoeB [Corchorus olitorius]|uniref:Molybdenum cofactor biosynthesis, MoeB n=1 Tax=Corchorus olitorius TaxID=93759 RepID=A0A1R3J6N1_9ROSI|nr:Molybdenum cofactor biosynthesis, MoeB [Corchorus olitorius]
MGPLFISEEPILRPLPKSKYLSGPWPPDVFANSGPFIRISLFAFCRGGKRFSTKFLQFPSLIDRAYSESLKWKPANLSISISLNQEVLHFLRIYNSNRRRPNHLHPPAAIFARNSVHALRPRHLAIAIYMIKLDSFSVTVVEKKLKLKQKPSVSFSPIEAYMRLPVLDGGYVEPVQESIANEGGGEAPLEGSIPDMTSSTEHYVNLQKLYKAKSEADFLAIEQQVRNILKKIGRDPDNIPKATIESFCKTVRFLKVEVDSLEVGFGFLVLVIPLNELYSGYS